MILRSPLISELSMTVPLERPSIDSSDSFDNAPEPCWTQPLPWLAAARECPELARLLATTICGRQPLSGDDLATWPRRFVHFPCWGHIQAAATSWKDRGDPLDDTCRLAGATRCVALYTSWANPEAAYWFGLFGERDSEDRGADLPHVSWPPLRRCRHLALSLLSYADLPGAAETVPFPSHWLRALQEIHHEIDWSALLAELRNLPTIEPRAFSNAMRQRLATAARLAGLEVELASRNALLAAATALTSTELGAALLALFARIAESQVALWIADASTDIGTGLVGSDPFRGDPGERGQEFVCSRRSFETERLPPALRCSLDLVDKQAGTVGRVYFTDPVPPEWPSEQIQSVVATITAFRERLFLRSQRSAATQQAFDTECRISQGVRAAITEFAAGAGHEINNPLGTILGKAQWLLSSETDPQRREALTKITRQVDRIRRMIRDLHFIGRTSRPGQQTISLAPILAQAVSQAAKAQPTELITLEPCDSELTLLGSDTDLVRMFEELMLNAIHAAGPRGRVVVRAISRRDRVVVEVSDSGPGFTSLDRRHAFDPFYSGRSAGRGLGMGLAVARRIAEDHGGVIELSFGRPTTVSVMLPLAESGG